jgi:hypothetical protein
VLDSDEGQRQPAGTHTRHSAHRSPRSGPRNRAGSRPIKLSQQAPLPAPMAISPYSAPGAGPGVADLTTRHARQVGTDFGHCRGCVSPPRT